MTKYRPGLMQKNQRAEDVTSRLYDRKVAVATRAQVSSGDLLATEFELPAFLCHLTRQHTADPDQNKVPTLSYIHTLMFGRNKTGLDEKKYQKNHSLDYCFCLLVWQSENNLYWIRKN